MLFSKMNGLGNDYIFFDSSNCNESDFNYLKKNVNDISKLLSDRNFGIGGDGVVLIENSKVADAKMRIFNADGTEGLMCGNALRCIGKILYDKSIIDKREYFVETLSGIKNLKIIENNPYEATILTDMGMPKLIKEKDNVEYYNIGNPHAVFYVDSLDEKAINKARELSLEYDVNAEAVLIENNNVMMRVWERGSGETLACGTGATCVAYSVIKNGFCNKKVEISLRGGNLTAIKEDYSLKIIGKAKLNYIGEININYYG